MKTNYTYLKNSNTGDIILKQEFTDTIITGIPFFYYKKHIRIDTPNLSGYVEISEKTYKRLMRKQK